jgi:hypothetical protein
MLNIVQTTHAAVIISLQSLKEITLRPLVCFRVESVYSSSLLLGSWLII